MDEIKKQGGINGTLIPEVGVVELPNWRVVLQEYVRLFFSFLFLFFFFFF